MKVRIAAVALGLTLAAGCGGGGKKSDERGEHAATPKQAIAQIGRVRDGLSTALASYRSGDKAAADRQVGDAYLQHFEDVEGPLGDRNEKLDEDLEDAIREELRDKIEAGAPKAQVAKLVREIQAKLDRAEAALRQE